MAYAQKVEWGMAGRECYHCKQFVEEGEAHDCWTTTEAALTKDLSEDLRDAWERLRETAVEFGDQRIYASHHSIMFSRKVCYFFVRPRVRFLELWIMLGRPLRGPQVRKVIAGSRTKFASMIRITHRDEVEAPITDWLHEAYQRQDVLAARAATKGAAAAPGRVSKASRVSKVSKRSKARKKAPTKKKRS